LLVSNQVADGAHINAVGAIFPERRELASDLVGRARIFVDSRESALAEAGDLLLAIREGRFQAKDINAEIGEVLLARHPGRTGEDEVTVFESLGLAAQDILSAHYLHDRARELGVGVTAELFSTDSSANP
jgi:ornithine cyclodeaminase